MQPTAIQGRWFCLEKWHLKYDARSKFHQTSACCMSSGFIAIAHKPVRISWSVGLKWNLGKLNLYWTIWMSWPMLCFCWVFSDWWLKIQRVGVVKHSTPTQPFLKCMFTLSFSKVPLDLCHCRSALPAPQTQNKHPALSCTSPEMYSNHLMEGTHSLTNFLQKSLQSFASTFDALDCLSY